MNKNGHPLVKLQLVFDAKCLNFPFTLVGIRKEYGSALCLNNIEFTMAKTICNMPTSVIPTYIYVRCYDVFFL